MIFFTSICSNYFDKAAVLGRSIKKHMPQAKFVVGLVEDSVPAGVLDMGFCDDVILAKDLDIPNFEAFIFKHRIVEASTSIKPSLTRKLMSKYKDENYFVFLDPDCCTFSDFEADLINHLSTNGFALTPHLLSAGNVDMEISCLKHGVFNLGFYAVKRSPEGEKFLKWWEARLYDFCYEDFDRGLFTDQKWINLAVAFFDPKIIRDPGYNFATWNFMERQLGKVEAGFTVDGKSLKFVHFSGHDKNTFEWAAKTWGNQTNQTFGKELADFYNKELAPFEKFKTIQWSYRNYNNGTPIKDTERVEFRQRWKDGVANPFNQLST